MLTLAVLAAASAALQSPALDSAAPWWERVTMTLVGDGDTQACHYETSGSALSSDACKEDAKADKGKVEAEAGKGVFTKITYERRFNPGQLPDFGKLPLGDQLLGRQVMLITIGADGGVSGCRVIATGGDMTPAYGCPEARSERFNAGAGAASQRYGFFTVQVYGHEEQIV